MAAEELTVAERIAVQDWRQKWVDENKRFIPENEVSEGLRKMLTDARKAGIGWLEMPLAFGRHVLLSAVDQCKPWATYSSWREHFIVYIAPEK